MLEKPELPPSRAGDDDEEDEFAGIDDDLAMLLHCSKVLFHSRNPAVVLATARMFYNLAPRGHKLVGQDLLVAPLIRLGESSDGEQIRALTWDVIADITEERPVCLLPLRI